MPTPTYVAIAKTVLTGSQATIEITGIAATYTDLILKVSSRNTASNNYYEVQFNNTTTNLLGAYIQANSSTVVGGNYQPYGRMNDSTTTANTFDSGEFYISNYAGSTRKTLNTDSASENNLASANAALILSQSGLWANTAAITSIKLVPSGGNFASGTRVDLYGIKNS